jgi:hypothetical protein
MQQCSLHSVRHVRFTSCSHQPDYSAYPAVKRCCGCLMFLAPNPTVCCSSPPTQLSAVPHPHTALYPIDTIKTRLQSMIGGGGFKALMSTGGGKGLYAGVWGNLAGA